MSKFCNKCSTEKVLLEFKKRTYASGNIGYQPWCYDCSKAFGKDWRKVKRKTDQIWAEADREKQRLKWATNSEYREKQKVSNRVRSKKHYQDNKPYYHEKYLARAYEEKQATPSWLTEFDRERIKIIYKVRDLLNKKTDTVWHVDHIIPLKGVNVCGLHIPGNLQVIPAEVNLSKRNKHEQWF